MINQPARILDKILNLKSLVSQSIIGQEHVVERRLIGLLADEINRAPAKVQAALLEAMEEKQVIVAGKTRIAVLVYP